MKVVSCEIVVIGDGPKVEPDFGGVEPLPLLTVHTDEGVTGMSEMFRVPPGVARSALVGNDSFFGSQIIGKEFVHPEAAWNRLYESMLHSNRRGWAMRCLGALDVALWDIYGKALGLPVFEIMGGSERSPYQAERSVQATNITPYATIVSDAYDRQTILRQQVERCELLAKEGFSAFKVEPLYSSRETAVELLRLAREALGPEPALALDVGYGYSDHATALWVARHAEEYDVYFFETPFSVDGTSAYARLSSMTSIPLAMGEHASSRFELIEMMDHGGGTVCQPYATNCGGLTECKRIVEYAKLRGAVVLPGNWSTQILGMATNHLAAYSPITPYIEYAPAQIYASPLRQEIQNLASPVVNGKIGLPTSPGVGMELPRELINSFMIDM